MSQELFHKCYSLICTGGDYVEFGAFEGGTMIQSYRAIHNIVEGLLGGVWDHSFGAEKEKRLGGLKASWDRMRFIAFDSFEGMPKSKGVDAVYEVFAQGGYSCSEEKFLANLEAAEVPLEKVVTVKGFFENTCTPETAKRIPMRNIGILHIDSDLYESAKIALDFCTPFFRDGTIIIFDEWFQFLGNPTLGEQRAFAEWRKSNPEWLVTEYQKDGPWTNSFILNKPVL